MLSGIKSKALLTGIMAVTIMISGCGVKKDPDDKAMLVIDKSIVEVNSDGQENLLDVSDYKANYWQYDSGNKLLIGSSWGNNASIYSTETGTKTDVGFPDIDGRWGDIEYEGQTMYALNAWYEDGKVSIYARNPADDTLVVFTFDCETEKLEDTAFYDIDNPHFVRDTGNLFVYMSRHNLIIYDKATGENKTVAGDMGTQPGRDYNELIVLNGDKSKVLFVKTIDDSPVLYEYDIPSGETREVYKCSKGEYITGFTYALGSNKIYLRYGKKTDAIVGYSCLPNHTMVITTDDRNYELHSSLTDGYDWNGTGIVAY